MPNPFVHVELNTTNIAAAKSFYGALFGWNLQDVPMAGDRTYTMIGVGEGTGGGMHAHPVAGAPSSCRAHANLAQHAPLALLLIGFAEAVGTSKTIIHVLGTVLVLARLLSAWGLLSAEGPTPGRQSGAGLTVLVLIAASVLILLREGGVM